MKKIFLVPMVSLALFVTGCEKKEVLDSYDPVELKVKYPEGLKDCKTYAVYTEKGHSLIITRCPASHTETNYGKNHRTTTIEN